MSGSLFGVPQETASESTAHLPLAERMRPLTLDEFCGQEHLVGEGQILRSILETETRQSLILWGRQVPARPRSRT